MKFVQNKLRQDNKMLQLLFKVNLMCFLLVRQVQGQFCTCIPFWECMEDKNDAEMENLIDIRQDSTKAKACTGYFDVCCKMKCGMRGTDNLDFGEDILRKRILGDNNEAKFGEFPWMLGVLYQNSYRCGASLIHPKVALTAAHCAHQNRHLYKVRAGEWNWGATNEPLKHQDRLVKRIVVHPQYQANSLRNDIALLVLDRAFSITENVGIICLPAQNAMIEARECVAAGWGKNSYKTDNYQSILKRVNLPIIPRGVCTKSLQEARLGPAFILHRSFVCAGGEPNKDTCKGDGGSPLMCPVEGNSNKYEQVGIVSWGLTCGLRSTPGVYVNVALFSNWIDGQLRLLNLDPLVYKSLNK